MIQTEALVKRFGTVLALDAVSFTARDACITGLLGPNGAGKSTALRILAAAMQADSGAVRIDGEALTSREHRLRRHIGILPHNSGLYPLLTARENIEYFGRLAGMTRAAARARTSAVIRQLELEEIADRRAKGFSQGQKIRTALGRALVHEPRNLMLDEPTNGLDVPAVRALRAMLAQLRNAGHCILFSSHVMQEVAQLCDEVVVIARGKVVATGNPEHLRERAGAANFEDAFVALTGADGDAA